MSKFTPGPWFVIEGFEQYYIGESLRSDTAFANCTGKTWEEAKANAHLMAAAPDLLEALMNSLECLLNDYHSKADIDLARATIAKARRG